MGRFDNLSDLDFETFVADLLRVALDIPYRAGIRGRDGGIDLLAQIGNAVHVVQCKHYRESTYAHLKNAATKERVKLEGRQSDFASYRFVTSKALSHEQRVELASILSPFVTDPTQVLGGNDVEQLLGDNPEVEGRHVKLWLGGAGALQSLLSAAAEERSLALLEETRSALPRYVETQAFREAREILGREGVCVIAGPPGVGKTTVARLLLLDGLEHGYQPYEIVPGSMADAWELLKRNERQVFYFDDFLGSTALDESRYADADLLRFIAKVARDKTRRFVLTTREYILRQAQRMSEVLDREASDAHRFLLTIDHYSRQERARIFYNHIYYSDEVDAAARTSLLQGRSYLQVVDHANYSPRLIEWITGWSAQRLGDAERADYASFCVQSLDSPNRLWGHAFKVGIEGPERALLLSLLGLPRRAEAGDVETAFQAACAARGLSSENHAFTNALQVLDDSFLSSVRLGDTLYLSGINPSLVDFLRSYVRESRADAELCLAGAVFFEQVMFLWITLETDQALRTSLAEAFSVAFERTFAMRPAKGQDPEGSPFHIWWSNRSADTGSRLDQVLACVDKSTTLRDACRTWLTAKANEWAKEASEREGAIQAEEVRLMGHLGNNSMLDVVASARPIKTRLQASGPSVYRWDRLDDLRRAAPSLFTDDEWADERDGFAAYADAALEDAGGYLDGVEDVDTLESVAGALDIPLDETQLEFAREGFLSDMEPPDRDWEPDDDDRYDDDSGFQYAGNDDLTIDAMFERLGED